MLNISGIHEGFVLDHIQAGMSLQIYHDLKLDKLDCSVAIIKNAKSNKMGKKDIIKVECPIEALDLDILGFIDHNITVNVTLKKGNGKNHKVTVPATSIVWDGKVVGIPCYKIDGAYYVSAAAIAELTDSRFEDTHYGWSIAPLLPNKIDAYG